jgi:uncharacterized membrane protein YsdA (DUF1294 family)
MTGWALVGWVLAVNLVAFVAFGVDKSRARRGLWRLSENYLLMLAALGGWIGAKAGQRVFRHKTHKQPFRGALNAILLVPLLAILALTTPLLSVIADSLGPFAAAPEELPERPFPRRFGPGSGD